MCPPLLALLPTAGGAAAGTAATTAAAAGTAAAGTAAAAGGAAASSTLAATALKAGITAGVGLLGAKLLAPKLPGAMSDAPPENTDPSGKVAAFSARRRAQIAGGRQSTLLTSGAGPVTPGYKTLLGS